MNTITDKASVILIGCGPHARRVYLPAFSKFRHIEVALVVDLECEESVVRNAIDKNFETEAWFIKPFKDRMPEELANRLTKFVQENEIKGVIIATEPLVHKAYAVWALQNSLNILMDKPITARIDATSKMSSAEGILNDYLELLERYREVQLGSETVFMINSQRRFHKGFQFVQEQILEVGIKTNCPVTFIQAYHCDGQWRMPNEIVTQEYHPYCFGYGKGSHSGYHIFDSVYQFYKASGVHDKLADTMDIASSFIQPNGFLTQLRKDDYRSIFGNEYDSINQWSDEQLKQICSDYGEIDLSSIITLKKNDVAVANFNVSLIHNGFAARTWIKPGEDLYKGNGRIKHESYHIQQGPFQNIQIHAYQAGDKHDENNGPEDHLGGKNHFDIYVFRNPLIAKTTKQPQVFKLTDFIDNAEMELGSTIAMESVKLKVVEEFADYLTGRKHKDQIESQIEDHIVPVQIMSGIYCSNIIKNRYSCKFDSSIPGPQKSCL